MSDKFTFKYPESWRHVPDDEVMSRHFSLPASLAKKLAERDRRLKEQEKGTVESEEDQAIDTSPSRGKQS